MRDENPFGPASTGNRALDQILGGGIPRNSLNIIAGEPGSGKTVLTLQMLFNWARAGKKTLYFTTLSEPALKLIHYMQLFTFFDADALESRIRFVDLGAALREGPDALVSKVMSQVESYAPDAVVIDSFRAVGEGTGEGRRALVYDLGVQLSAFQVITFMVGEYLTDEYSACAEFAIADGIIRLATQHQELLAVREIEVLKMRGADYVRGRHFYEITGDGLAVFPRVRAPLILPTEAHTTGARISTGVDGLDELLGGGLPARSTTVVKGGTGIGKTILALHFLLEGARRGEQGVFFGLEETPAHLRDVATSLGLDLVEQEKRGLISIEYASPVELSTDRYLFEACSTVERLRASRAVFDSLTSMSLGVASQRRFKELVYSIAKHLRQAGATSLMTMESEQTFGSSKLTGYGISFLADVLIQMRYLELDGHLERAISVIKARGINHLMEFRSLAIGDGGLKVVAGRFDRLRGMLTGLPAM